MISITTGFSFAAVVAMAGAAMATGPKGKVVPNLHLKNGETVKVSGAGFPHNVTFFILECNKTVRKMGGIACDEDNVVSANSDAKGRVPATRFTVHTGGIGDGMCGTSQDDKKCYIVFADSLKSDVASVGILFKVP
jgi:hypothetical protein